MMEQLTKSDLKTGMHVVIRSGMEFVVLRDTLFKDKDIMVSVSEDVNGALPCNISKIKIPIPHQSTGSE